MSKHTRLDSEDITMENCQVSHLDFLVVDFTDKDSENNNKGSERMHGNAADMSDEAVSQDQSRNRHKNGRDTKDDSERHERNERERKASQEMYSRINNPEKYSSEDNVIRIRRESVDLKQQDF